MEVGGVTPAVNQYRVAVGLGDTVQHNISQVKAFCAAAVPPIGLEAFSTLSSGCMGLPTVQSIAVAHNVSAAMVCLRWIVQQGMSVVVSSDEARFDREDLLAASTGSPFVLSDAEMVRLSALRAPAAAPQRQRLHSALVTRPASPRGTARCGGLCGTACTGARGTFAPYPLIVMTPATVTGRRLAQTASVTLNAAQEEAVAISESSGSLR